MMLGEQGEIVIPTVEFNLIFQLTHIYAHLMNEGDWFKATSGLLLCID